MDMSIRFFADILIGLFVYLLLNCRNSFYILDTSLISYIIFSNKIIFKYFLPLCGVFPQNFEGIFL